MYEKQYSPLTPRSVYWMNKRSTSSTYSRSLKKIECSQGAGSNCSFQVLPPSSDSVNIPMYSALIPVSYTHLRAHETSLHLVCRLLLEKKKQTNTKQQLSA
eukprot:TRINITY_DN10522_c0_g2_i1.p5 TRINITY_DN10522_c0_g2~~TRINITY_DN10522_c0_g2_i1.p5  ORF type:complete len:101 (-),score=11.48 TRINITY_DN10522_c0_g2_i1:42-344(-)